MAKADRLERLDVRRAELEADYEAALIAALQTAAGGVWGLFDHKPDRQARARTAPVIAALDELAADIDAPVASDAPGEPKQARAWLEKMGVAIG